MSLIQHELSEIRKFCESRIANCKLIACMESMVRVEINNTEVRKLIVCFQFSQDYPGMDFANVSKVFNLFSYQGVLIFQELQYYLN